MSSIKAITNLNLKHLIDQLKATWFIGRDEKGVAGGVATLDNDGKITLSQSPTDFSIAMWTKGISLNQGSNVINKASIGETLTPIFVNIEFFEGENTVLLNYTEVVENGCILGYNVTVTPDHDNVVAHVTYRIKEAVASQAALTSEGYAVGTQNGVEVGSSSPYWHNNAKYFAENGGSGTVVVTTNNTYAEIKNLYDSGKTIVLSTGADKKGVFLPLIKYDENNSRFIFGGATGESSNASVVITQEGSDAEQKNFMTTLNSGRSDILKLDGNGKATYAVAGTDYQAPLEFMTAPSSSNKVATAADLGGGLPTTSSILKGDGNGGATSAVAGADYQAPLEFMTAPSSSNKVATAADLGGGYTLPTATASTLGGIKVGDNLAINNGVLTSQNVVEVELTSAIKPILTKSYIQSTYLNKGIYPIFKVPCDGGAADKCVELEYIGINNSGDLVFGAIYMNGIWTVTAGASGIGSVSVTSIQEAITFNTAYDATTNKAATMADVPTTLASLTEDDTHKTVTATEKSTWTAKADLASPTFTGVPVAPTAAAGTNTTQIATTAFVKAAIDAEINDALNASY